MATEYKILGQGVNNVQIDAPDGGSVVVSEIRVKNLDHETNVDVMVSDDFSLPGSPYYDPNNEAGKLNPNGIVRDLAKQSDGKIIVAGEFTSIGGQSKTRIARLNADGTLDTGFTAAVPYNVNNSSTQVDRVIVLSNDKIIIYGGGIATVDGVPRGGVARLNSDGSLDTTFGDPDLRPFSSAAYGMSEVSDNKVLVYGNFTTVNGITRNRMLRLNADGSLDTGFDPNFNAAVRIAIELSDGKIIVGGDFTTVGGTARNYLCRLNSDGSLDTTFDLGLDSYVRALALQPDGKLLVGGDFDNVSGTVREKIARLNTDDSLDTTFRTYFFDEVKFIEALSNEKIIAFSNQPRAEYKQYNSKWFMLDGFGNVDESGINAPFVNFYGKPIVTSSNVFAGGAFTNTSGQPRIYKNSGQNSLIYPVTRIYSFPIPATCSNADYLARGKTVPAGQEIKITGGIALESGDSLRVDARPYTPGRAIIQVYGIEETA